MALTKAAILAAVQADQNLLTLLGKTQAELNQMPTADVQALVAGLPQADQDLFTPSTPQTNNGPANDLQSRINKMLPRIVAKANPVELSTDTAVRVTFQQKVNRIDANGVVQQIAGSFCKGRTPDGKEIVFNVREGRSLTIGGYIHMKSGVAYGLGEDDPSTDSYYLLPNQVTMLGAAKHETVKVRRESGLQTLDDTVVPEGSEVIAFHVVPETTSVRYRYPEDVTGDIQARELFVREENEIQDATIAAKAKVAADEIIGDTDSKLYLSRRKVWKTLRGEEKAGYAAKFGPFA
jgi:hypothetical protein